MSGVAPGDAAILAEETPGGEQPESQAPREGRSPSQIAIERLRTDIVAMVSLGVIIFFVIVAVGAPLWTSLLGVDDQQHQELLDINTGIGLTQMSAAHPFGVEAGSGVDLFYKWAYGARPSLVIGILAAGASVVIGAILGLLAGFFGGWTDRVIQWLIDFFLALPFLLMAIGIIPIAILRFGGADSIGFIEPETEAKIRFAAVVLVLALFGWTTVARLVRGEVLSLREREFVQASKALGASSSRVLFKEMLPNLVSPILVNLTILIPAYISAEAGLSFLGVGLQPPTYSWGQTIASAESYFEAYPIWLWVPAGSVAILVLALSLFGDAVSDAFNPQTRR
ncbi:ABC transporter permease [Demetria terragena]|uniref:ABC transporter permease n=1 Tax=Demetria terragena TaxID=63959 RepID=UPI0003A62AEC|nr:ABC transporter permease [Demetria terragena]